MKNADNSYILQNADLTFLSKETDIPLEIVKEKCEMKHFKNTRELMQYIGTDLIREYNPNWHVNKTKEILLNNVKQNYVVDDVRFPNERNMIEELGGNCWFIVRPKLNNVSNHTSETALKWQDFNNIIINNKSVDYLKFKWNQFLKNDYIETLIQRKNILHEIYKDKKNNIFTKSKEELITLDLLFITKYEFSYNERYKNNENVEKVEQKENFVNVYLKNGDVEIISNPLIIEDLKNYVK